MMYETVIRPALQASNFVSEELNDTTGSLEMKIDTGKRVHRDSFRYDVPGSSALSYEWYKADAIDVTLPPLTLTLKESLGSPTYLATWEWQYSCKWAYDDAGPSGAYGAVEDHVTKGTTTGIHTLPKNDWNVTFKPEDRSGWDSFWDGPDVVPIWMKGLDVEIPDFDLQLGSVDFFLTTNLLFPGDKQVIDIDRTAGLHIPGDVYLVGNVKTN
ncbi:hypothetical protein F5I97DRAFT_1810475 [Phlebopus sp. FC_14]|nr:hypothetical protein F5I97DRAFT_1818390 [Phlebopus sp. FC_14]KAH7885560.1 hypothetical protein F5I97DRAFT_1810475 [Phlebopus sp. FC_14]